MNNEMRKRGKNVENSLFIFLFQKNRGGSKAIHRAILAEFVRLAIGNGFEAAAAAAAAAAAI